MRNIYIYGAGEYGKALLRWCNSTGIKISAFVQTTCEDLTNIFMETPIVCIDSLKICREDVFLIAIANSTENLSVRTNLVVLYGVSFLNVYDLSSFIGRYLAYKRSYYCILCGDHITGFKEGGERHVQLFNKHHIIGAGKRLNHTCPNCGCTDRSRFVFFVLRKYTKIFEEDLQVLHFAPEPWIEKRIIKECNTCKYITADVVNGRAGIVVDMTSIPFLPETFDCIIANHVLEHIYDEESAMRELIRVLKKDGQLIISFPICTDQNTYEDENATTDEQRLESYGQEDHVRLYGKDYVKVLKKYQFKVKSISPRDLFDDGQIEEYGFIPDDIVIICEKMNKD